MTDSQPQPASARNLTVDGLRGVAAMLVVLYHLHHNVLVMVQSLEPGWLAAWLDLLGSAGVDMFFVLSGFVISMTLLRAPLTWGYVGRYALRRSVRLDPPYWATMLLCMGLSWFSVRLFPAVATDRDAYTWPQVLAHLLYLQDILGFPQISSVFWTLCIEVQFYLVFILLLMLTRSAGERQALRLGPVATRVRRLGPALLLGSMALSIVIDAPRLHLPVEGLFIRHWHMFALGVFLCWFLHGDVGARWLVAALAGEALVFGFRPDFARAMPLVAAAVLVYGDRLALLRRALHAGLAQYMGRISYSLYLTHAALGWSVISLLKRLFGDPPHAGLALAYMGAGLAVSLLTADLLYRAVEQPAVRLSKRVRLPRPVP